MAGWIIIALALFVAALAAFGITLLMTPVYESHTQMFLSTSGSTYSSDTYVGNLFSGQAMPAYAELLTNQLLTSKVIADLALDLTPAELADKVRMTYSPETVVFDIVATDTSPELARDIANTMATELAAVVADLETPGDGEPPSVALRIRNVAEVADAPISPNAVAYLAWGAAVGLLIGTASVLVRHRSNGNAR